MIPESLDFSNKEMHSTNRCRKTKRVPQWTEQNEERRKGRTALQERSTWMLGEKNQGTDEVPFPLYHLTHVMQENFIVTSMGLEVACQGSKPSLFFLLTPWSYSTCSRVIWGKERRKTWLWADKPQAMKFSPSCQVVQWRAECISLASRCLSWRAVAFCSCPIHVSLIFAASVCWMHLLSLNLESSVLRRTPRLNLFFGGLILKADQKARPPWRTRF